MTQVDAQSVAETDDVPLPEPLDPRQVERIGRVHEGYLYQHLYAVACLLTVGRSQGARVIVERDEDSEFLVGDEWTYTQVKVRSRPLQRGDIAGALDRFEQIRQEHATGRRPGAPRFQVVTNAALGPGLSAAESAEDWPSDVRLITPGRANGAMPPAWESIDTAFAWCAERASDVPFGALSSETLVWKLAALVLHASTGARDRTFLAEDLPGLLEQLLLQLQDFPDPPEHYRPQIDEPQLTSKHRLRVIVAFSGAGKTAWASQAALHSPAPVAYFDVSEMPSASMATNLARELSARFAGGRRAGQGGGVFAQSSGLNVLRTAAQQLAQDGLSVLVILDNAHKVDAEALRSLLEAAPNLRFLCLAQPWPGAATLEAQFAIQIEQLRGWSPDDIAAEFAAAGAPSTVEAAHRLQRLTGGLPLYVRNAAFIAARDYGGDADAFADAVEARINDQATAQEIILEAAFNRLDANCLKVAGVLAISDVSLTRAETLALLSAIDVSEVDAARALRLLRRGAIVVGYQGDRIGLHDATRVLAVDAGGLGEPQRATVEQHLVQLLLIGVQRERDVSRLSFLLRLLPRVGLLDVLVDLAGDEMLHEQGDPRSLRDELENAANDTAKSARDQFWANDVLAYWESRDGGQPSRGRLDHMSHLIAEANLGASEQMALVSKELSFWGLEGDLAQVERLFQRGQKLKVVAANAARMLRYNYAIGLYRAKALPKARRVVDLLIADYFAVLGITEQQVHGKSNLAIEAMVRAPFDREDFKRLGDALSLWSIIVVDMKQQPLLRRITAMKFYGLGHAARSVVLAGTELADDFTDQMGDAFGALQVMEEHVLPVMREAQLTDLIVPVRSHYAIVLAWNGRADEARKEVMALQTYAGSPEQAAMLTERAAAIEEIAAGRARLVRKSPPADALPRILGTRPKQAVKIGRNAPCPCGSGDKFKRCCGGR